MKRVLIIALAIWPMTAEAHGIVGDRFFPATLNIDDPAVADELTLPQVRSFKEADDSGVHAWSTETSAEFSKRITQDFGLSIGGTYIDQSNGAGGQNGFDNAELSGKYQFYKNAPHETLVSFGVDWDIGGSGSKRVQAEDFSTLTPQLFFGKGFGDLPDSMDYLKPLAVTGVFGVAFPTNRYSDGEEHPDLLHYGFSLQYSIPYLQQHVKDIGLGAPFNHVIPVVEFTFDSPINRADDHGTTGTINPGFIWSGQTMQVGLEAVLPLNNKSGSGVGVMGQMHFYLDDIFPATLGRPLIGN